jgi:hypothetical protein
VIGLYRDVVELAVVELAVVELAVVVLDVVELGPRVKTE